MGNKINYRLVSIIICSYKNTEYIFDTINSVLTQDYQNIELIISDDHTENFNENIYIDYITKNNKGNIKNVIVHKNGKNLGTVKNANNAIKMSKGSIVKLIAADDAFYDETVITSFVRYFELNHSYIVASKIARCDKNLNIVKNSYSDEKNELKFKALLLNFDKKKCFVELCMGSFIPAPGVCFTKEAFIKYGYFDEAYRLIEDWPMWLRLVRLGCRIDYLDIMSVKYRTNVGVSMTPNETFREENFQCIKTDIIPYIKDLGYWLNKKIKWKYIKGYEYDEYTNWNKSKFLIKNIDFIFAYIIPNKIKLKIYTIITR
ncbi:glycosyltransferase [Acetobacterium wieringae]|uniref:Glycosyltransferase n=1 Tax=Acetobacterium wieringae TaxID=52694 RepID=A0A5D0WGW4_9FIRM|nr:glycosyltransferase [Acetobacterium wieringae]TYC82196.1 glycosyltransferase [Acetobacterium wieringae]